MTTSSKAMADEEARYIFIIDDSSSMNDKSADISRLSVFAARSMLEMLDDREYATVMRLNASNDQVVPLNPLSQNRSALIEQLSLDGAMARYQGNTPCRDALGRLERLLEDSPPNSPHVVIYLTDGECNPSQDVTAALQRKLLDGTAVGRSGQLQFYLLFFQGRRYSKGLRELAGASNGKDYEVSCQEPARILKPFGDALARAQGYESRLLTPTRHEVPAFEAASRVRLLAVAQGGGEPLKLDLRTGKGKRAKVDKLRESSGTHQYQQQTAYRFVMLDYKPIDEPLDISVRGASDWKILVLPEYRLRATLDVNRGSCADPGQKTISLLKAGGDACIRVNLATAEGKVVSPEVFGRDHDGILEWSRAGKKPKSLPGKPLKDRLSFEIDRPSLSEGDYVMTPKIHLKRQDGSVLKIVGSSQTLTASTTNIRPSPQKLDFKTLKPGQRISKTLKFTGNFQKTRATYKLIGEGVPKCLKVRLGGRKHGQSLDIHQGQEYQVVLNADPYCGPEQFNREIQATLQVNFERSRSSQLPTIEIPITSNLNYRIKYPSRLKSSFLAGGSSYKKVLIKANNTAPMHFVARARMEEGLKDVDIELSQESSDGPSERVVVGVKGNEQPPLSMKISADVCCKEGLYRGRLVLLPVTSKGVPIQGVDPLSINIKARVDDIGMLACWGRTIFNGFLTIAILLFILYLYRLYHFSHFIDLERLSRRFSHLKWNDAGCPEQNTQRRVDRKLKAGLKRHMGFWARARAWFSIKTLLMGIVGSRYEYHETVRLSLDSRQGDARKTGVQFMGRKDLERTGTAFGLYARASASNSARLFCIPKVSEEADEPYMQVGTFWTSSSRKPRGDERLVLLDTKRTDLLNRKEEDVDEDDLDKFAGWRIGG